MSRGALLPVAGFIIWAWVFVVLYAMLSVGCRLGWEDIAIVGALTLQRAQLIAIFIVHAVVLGMLVLYLKRRRHAGFVWHVSYCLSLAALAAAVFNFGWVFVLSTCL